MIKNFAELQKQLKELSSTVNAFKSEAVQLRVVELILGGVADEDKAPANSGSQLAPRRIASRGRRKKKKAAKGADVAKKSSSRSHKGAARILDELIADGFFQKKRIINDIMKHCSSQKARTFKANELSSPLARFVREKRLKRDQNPDGQYEYHK